MAQAIYIHIPYCKTKCPYCDFSSVAAVDPPLDSYVEVVVRELKMRTEEGAGPISTVYLGGGTPSLLSGGQVQDLLDAVDKSFGIAGDAEITLEANPETITPKTLADFARAGVNRLSVGVQSFNDRALKALGRNAGASVVKNAVAAAMSSPIGNVSLDVIYGLWDPNQEAVMRDAHDLVAADPQHISAYCLTIYDETPLGRQIKQGLRERPEDDKAAREYEALCACFMDAGYEQYEISNFAKPGARSRHNENYWLRKSYIGLGASAASFTAKAPGAPHGFRFCNESNPDIYMASLISGQSVRRDWERITDSEALAEMVFLGMRMLRGVSISAIEGRFEFDFRRRFSKALDLLGKLALIEIVDDRLRLTRKGLFLSDEVFSYFV